MSHRVDIDYNLEPYEMLEWCEENLGGPIDLIETGGWQGPNWMIFHTSTDVLPYYIVTRAVFDSTEDAVLFKIRWG